MSWIAPLFAKAGNTFLALLITVAASLGWGVYQNRRGYNDAKTDAWKKDATHAQDISDRVDRNLPERVRKLDEAGYRD